MVSWLTRQMPQPRSSDPDSSKTILSTTAGAPIGLSRLYGILRPDFESAMQSNADHCVREYRAKHRLPPCAGGGQAVTEPWHVARPSAAGARLVAGITS